MILQLNPTISVDTPLGRGHTIFIIDYGMHQNSCWVVVLEQNGIVKHFDSNDVIVCCNHTYNINKEKNCFKKKGEETTEPNQQADAIIHIDTAQQT